MNTQWTKMGEDCRKEVCRNSGPITKNHPSSICKHATSPQRGTGRSMSDKFKRISERDSDAGAGSSVSSNPKKGRMRSYSVSSNDVNKCKDLKSSSKSKSQKYEVTSQELACRLFAPQDLLDCQYANGISSTETQSPLAHGDRSWSQHRDYRSRSRSAVRAITRLRSAHKDKSRSRSSTGSRSRHRNGSHTQQKGKFSARQRSRSLSPFRGRGKPSHKKRSQSRSRDRSRSRSSTGSRSRHRNRSHTQLKGRFPDRQRSRSLSPLRSKGKPSHKKRSQSRSRDRSRSCLKNSSRSPHSNHFNSPTKRHFLLQECRKIRSKGQYSRVSSPGKLKSNNRFSNSSLSNISHRRSSMELETPSLLLPNLRRVLSRSPRQRSPFELGHQSSSEKSSPLAHCRSATRHGSFACRVSPVRRSSHVRQRSPQRKLPAQRDSPARRGLPMRRGSPTLREPRALRGSPSRRASAVRRMSPLQEISPQRKSSARHRPPFPRRDSPAQRKVTNLRVNSGVPLPLTENTQYPTIGGARSISRCSSRSPTVSISSSGLEFASESSYSAPLESYQYTGNSEKNEAAPLRNYEKCSTLTGLKKSKASSKSRHVELSSKTSKGTPQWKDDDAREKLNYLMKALEEEAHLKKKRLNEKESLFLLSNKQTKIKIEQSSTQNPKTFQYTTSTCDGANTSARENKHCMSVLEHNNTHTPLVQQLLQEDDVSSSKRENLSGIIQAPSRSNALIVAADCNEDAQEQCEPAATELDQLVFGLPDESSCFCKFSTYGSNALSHSPLPVPPSGEHTQGPLPGQVRQRDKVDSSFVHDDHVILAPPLNSERVGDSTENAAVVKKRRMPPVLKPQSTLKLIAKKSSQSLRNLCRESVALREFLKTVSPEKLALLEKNMLEEQQLAQSSVSQHCNFALNDSDLSTNEPSNERLTKLSLNPKSLPAPVRDEFRPHQLAQESSFDGSSLWSSSQSVFKSCINPPNPNSYQPQADVSMDTLSENIISSNLSFEECSLLEETVFKNNGKRFIDSNYFNDPLASRNDCISLGFNDDGEDIVEVPRFEGNKWLDDIAMNVLEQLQAPSTGALTCISLLHADESARLGGSALSTDNLCSSMGNNNANYVIPETSASSLNQTWTARDHAIEQVVVEVICQMQQVCRYNLGKLMQPLESLCRFTNHKLAKSGPRPALDLLLMPSSLKILSCVETAVWSNICPSLADVYILEPDQPEGSGAEAMSLDPEKSAAVRRFHEALSKLIAQAHLRNNNSADADDLDAEESFKKEAEDDVKVEANEIKPTVEDSAPTEGITLIDRIIYQHRSIVGKNGGNHVDDGCPILSDEVMNVLYKMDFDKLYCCVKSVNHKNIKQVISDSFVYTGLFMPPVHLVEAIALELLPQ